MKTAGIALASVTVGTALGLAILYVMVCYGGDWLEQSRFAVR